jgi:hypothetical protein
VTYDLNYPEFSATLTAQIDGHKGNVIVTFRRETVRTAFSVTEKDIEIRSEGAFVRRITYGPTQIQSQTEHGRTSFEYDGTGNFTRATITNPQAELNAAVSEIGSNQFVVEMPSYGDPIPFSHRFELWLYSDIEYDLIDAAINSYLLPAGTFDFIFPFFAPTPQEVFEQAAAGE